MKAVFHAPSRALLLGIGLSLGALTSHGQTFGVFRELWSGLSTSDTSLNNLTNPAVNPNWPDNPTPTYTRVFTVFETETDFMNGYGQRLRAFVVPPVNGEYVFWIASDDQSVLLLGQEESPENATVVAFVSGWTSSRNWNDAEDAANQRSQPIFLEAGRRYYLEALMKEGGGGDNLAVRWQLPNGVIEEPLPAQSANGTRLIPYRGVDTVPGIFRDPTDATGLEGGTATFSVLATNQGQLFYQWEVNGEAVDDPAARRSAYTVANLDAGLNGARLRCMVSNTLGAVFSAEAELTVLPDTDAPTLVSVLNVASTNVVVTFSEPVEPASATNVANYVIDNGVAVLGAALVEPDKVLLEVTPLGYGTNYLLTVNAVRDRASAGNVIASDSQISFTAFGFNAVDVGAALPAGGSTNVADGFDVAGGGAGIGGNADQFQFNSQLLLLDFDLRVRVQSLTAVDTWSKAGLMARETLETDSRFASVLATPALAGAFFESRATPGSATTFSGAFPVNYPQTWLRLQRVGDVVTGYAGMDGEHWVALGSMTLSVRPVYVGMAVTSRSTNQTALAELRDYSPVENPQIGQLVYRGEPLGPSSRRTPLVISEIMYHPRPIAGMSNSLEFIELYSSQPWDEDLTGHRISGSVDYTFPSNTVIQPGQFLVVARDPAAVESYYGISGVLGPWEGAETNSLPGGAGTVRLRNPAGAVLLEVKYRGGNPWPIAADGAGHSLVLWRPSFGEGNPLGWAASARKDGSPGRLEPFDTEPLRSVVINEFLANSEPPLEDYIELYNHSSEPADLSGAFLSDEGSTNKYRIADGTILPPGEFIRFNQSTLGFALRSTGERIYLVNSNDTRVVDVVDYAGQATGVSAGRYPDGAEAFVELATRSPGAANGPPLPRPVVINEIMYHPISGERDDEYVELYNRSDQPVDVGHWKFVDGIDFTLPPDTVLAPGGYLVIARDRTNLLARYPGVLTAANTVGDYDGSLANGGERLALAMPEYTVTTDTNTFAVTVATNFVVVNEVTYGDDGRWGTWSDGGGSSLELKDPDSDNRLAANWADSEERAKSEGMWTTIDYTNVIGETLNRDGINNRLEVFLLGIGECLVDDLEVRNNAGADANALGTSGTFESGMAGWTLRGSFDMSTVESPGYNSAQSLHLRAGSRGDNGPNLVFFKPLSPLAASPVTLRGKVRWLRGWPEILLRIHGGGIEVSTRLQVPTNLGSPGQPNSCLVTNAGPAIWGVSHQPVLPKADEPVLVTAYAADPDGLGALHLNYRLEPGAATGSVLMVDDGTAGDAVAGDGLYSGQLPGQPAGTRIAFHLEAEDAAGATNTFPQNRLPDGETPRLFPMDAPSKDCLVRWGEVTMPGSFPSYHMWLADANEQRWRTRDRLNNAFVDCTFVYNNYRVIYNGQARYAGSPWHSGQMTTGPTGTQRVDFDFHSHADDLLLGETDFVLNNPGNPGGTSFSDRSLQSEQTSYLIFKGIGAHYNHRRYIHLFVNGDQRSTIGGATLLMEDSQQPNRNVVREWYPDNPDGEFFKVEDWFEFSDIGYGHNNNDADLIRRTVTYNGQTTFQTSAYRFMWRFRGVSAGQSASDYRHFFKLIDVVSPAHNASSPTIENPEELEAVVNVEQWMRIFACQHTVGNWDSYGYRRGKNAYMYRTSDGRYEQMTWDIDFTMGIGGDGSSEPIITFSTNPNSRTSTDPRIIAMWTTPVFARMYWRAYQDIIDGPLNHAYLDPIIDAKAAAMAANQIQYNPNQVNTIKNYITSRRAYIAGQIPNASFTIAGPDTFTNANNLVTLAGSAPVAVKYITVNGRRYPVTWTTVTGWQLQVALDTGTNVLMLQGQDRTGAALDLGTNAVTVIYEGPAQAPEDFVVLNEILYDPTAPGTEFVELFNRSTNVAFDLSGWRLNGVDFTFPDGTLLRPQQYLLAVQDRAALTTAFGGNLPIAGEFNGRLDDGGETLSLIRPGATPAEDVVIDQVKYDDDPPWSAAAAGSGPSLQLLDGQQDNRRVSNWSEDAGWRQVVLTGIPQTTKLTFFLESAGDVYIDHVTLVEGTEPEVGVNLIQNGDFEAPLGTLWRKLSSHAGSTISSDVVYEGNGSLHIIATAPGNSFFNVFQVVSGMNVSATHTLSFHFLPTTSATRLTARFSSTLGDSINVQPVDATPGKANTVARRLPAYDPLWLNEVQPVNHAGITNRFGEHDPWIELYNAGTNAIGLEGYFLANNYSNLLAWPFPAGATIAPGEFLVVWADGDTNQTVGLEEWHTSFALAAGTGSVALVRLAAGQPQITDYLNYSGLEGATAYGDLPDGQPLHQEQFLMATPGAPNARTAVALAINEWMANNGDFLLDPADNDADDWLELYNPNDFTADLSGYFLTDDLANPNKFRIPNGTLIPARGFLLVWADEEGNQNGPGRELHANFRISANGEELGLFSPGGAVVDMVDFNGQPQTNNVSLGRYPDGAASILPMTAPTPRTTNVLALPNTPPQLTLPGDQRIVLGQTLDFLVGATDAEMPRQYLLFSLDPGAPAGARLHPFTGEFIWTPTADQAPGLYPVTIRATDSGLPRLNTSASLLIEVVVPPLVQLNNLNNGVLEFTFGTVSNATYRVEYTASLEPPVAWTPLPGFENVPANGQPVTVTEDTQASLRRFYRIAILPDN